MPADIADQDPGSCSSADHCTQLWISLWRTISHVNCSRFSKIRGGFHVLPCLCACFTCFPCLQDVLTMLLVDKQMLHAVWSAFFMAWSTELNIQSSAEIHGMADERNRLTEELTARRHEAMQMRDGIQRLMRDQVDRMLQV